MRGGHQYFLVVCTFCLVLSFETGPHCVTQGGCELIVLAQPGLMEVLLLSLLSAGIVYRHVPPSLLQWFILPVA